MICFDTTISAWSVTVTVGVDADTYSGSAGTDALTAMVAFETWLLDGARPWTGVTFSFWWVTDRDSGAVRWTLTADQAFTLTSVSANDLGWGNEPTPALTHTAADPATGCWGGLSADGRGAFMVRDPYPFLGATGDASGVGAVRSGVPGLATNKPGLEAIATAGATAALDVLLRTTSGDRLGYCRERTPATTYTYRLRIGPVTRQVAGKALYRLAFDARIIG